MLELVLKKCVYKLSEEALKEILEKHFGQKLLDVESMRHGETEGYIMVSSEEELTSPQDFPLRQVRISITRNDYADPGRSRVELIKCIRSACGAGLLEAKNMVDDLFSYQKSTGPILITEVFESPAL